MKKTAQMNHKPTVDYILLPLRLLYLEGYPVFSFPEFVKIHRRPYLQLLLQSLTRLAAGTISGH